jgi:hypothetical protein
MGSGDACRPREHPPAGGSRTSAPTRPNR